MSNITWREVEPASVAIIPTDADTVIIIGPNAEANRLLFGAAGDVRKRLHETNEMLKRLLDDETIEESHRSEVAVQLEYNKDAIAKAGGR